MHWSTALYKAAESFDGGVRSFPLAQEAAFANRLGYEVPNRDYHRLFWSRKQTHWSQTEKRGSSRPHSAGWLVPNPTSDVICKPVFVAHSALGAIWLLRETLGDHALISDGWCSLVRAAEELASNSSDASGVPLSTEDAFAMLEEESLRLLPTHTRNDLRRHTTEDSEGEDDEAEVPPSVQIPCSLPVEPGKRPASPAPGSSPKRARGSKTPRSPIEPSEDETLQAESCITTITNNNRRADSLRKKKLDASRAKKRLGHGLQEPGDKAPLQERAAYNAIPLRDEPTIAWIIRQNVSGTADFYTASPTPYYTACGILEKARALGNQSSQRYAAQFLHAWREQGTPFKATADDQQLLYASQIHLVVPLSQQVGVDSAFCFAWGMCRHYETALAAVHIGSRWALALLGEAYAQKVQQIRQSDFATSNDHTRNRYGKGPVRTEAIAALVKLVYPAPTKRDHEVFRNRLKQAKRWHTIVQGLGWGSLLLIPHEEVSNWWLERVLRVGQLQVFIDLVKRERPDLCAASQSLDAWLGPDGIAGGPISGKQTLSIEAQAPTSVYEVEEIQDSEDEDIEEVMETEAPLDTQETVAPPAQLRQMTLLELFHPVKGAQSKT